MFLDPLCYVNYLFLLKPHETYCFLTLGLNPHWKLRNKPYSIGRWGGMGGDKQEKINEK